jgi:hypothetical protein
VLHDSSVRERYGLKKGKKKKDLRRGIDTFIASRISDIEVFARLQGMHVDVNPRVLGVKNGAAGQAVRKRGCLRAIQGVRLVDDAQVLRIADLTHAGRAMSGGSRRESVGGGKPERRIGWSGIRGNNRRIGGLSRGDVGRGRVGRVVLRLGHGRREERTMQGKWETHQMLYDLLDR